MTGYNPAPLRREFEIGDFVELIVSGVVTEVLGVDDSDDTFMDSTGAWHSMGDAEFVR